MICVNVIAWWNVGWKEKTTLDGEHCAKDSDCRGGSDGSDIEESEYSCTFCDEAFHNIWTI